MQEDKTKLVFSVWKPIWLVVEEKPELKIIGWTTKKPSHDNGFIEPGAWLIFDHIEEKRLSFMIFKTGPISDFDMPEFSEDDIKHLVEEEALILQDTEMVNEISITPKGLLIRDFQGWTFNRNLISSKNTYLIMGSEESIISKHKIKIGDKVSLKHILELYSIAVGQGLL